MSRICGIPDCDGAHRARGFCNTHWKRWKKWGDPLRTAAADRDDLVRFWSLVEKTSHCWLWKGCLTDGGYGQFHFQGRTVRAHRWIYERTMGVIQEGLEPDHLCRNRACVRPDHLEPVTRRENIMRGDGPALTRARQLAITHCPHGHAYDQENTFYRRDGRRDCRLVDDGAPEHGWAICRRGGAVAVTIPEIIPGFRGLRQRWWPREAEAPFPDWKSAGASP